MPTSIMAGFSSWVKANAAIVAIQAARFYNGSLPQPSTAAERLAMYPCSVGSLISDIALEHTHDQKAGPRQARVQVDVYALTTAAAESLIETYYSELAAQALTMGAFSVAAFDEGRNPDEDFIDEVTLRSVKHRSRDFMLVY